MCDKDPIVYKNMTEFVELKKKFYLERILEIRDNRLKIYDDIYFKNKNKSSSQDTKIKVKSNNLPTLKTLSNMTVSQIHTNSSIPQNLSMKSIFEKKAVLCH